MSREAWSAVVLPHASEAVVLAAVMARLHCPLVAVVGAGRLLGVVTVGRLLDRLLP